VPVVATNPSKILGPWTTGWVLARHTVSSAPTGDPYYPFDTKRTELGELLYQLKYRNRSDALASIVETAVDFVQHHWPGIPKLDCLVAVPPSLTTRRLQPAFEIAKGIAAGLGIQTCENAVVKAKPTQQMKNIEDWAERRKALEEAIQKGDGDVRGRTVLLFDDLIESGSSLARVAEVLLKDGGASAVYVLALTRTK